MTSLVPNRFLFDFEFPLAYRAAKSAPIIDGDLSDWSDRERLPSFSSLDGQTDFAEVFACWNEGGLYIACHVEGKKRPLRCDPKTFWKGDSLRLCIDTRDARTNRRATRTCQLLYFLPAGGGPAGKSATAGTSKIQRAREDAPVIDSELIHVASRVTKSGYTLEGHIPAACLSGFDPAEHPRIGLYYIVEDGDFGQQYLTVGDDLLWYVDPSTWATAVLEK